MTKAGILNFLSEFFYWKFSHIEIEIYTFVISIFCFSGNVIHEQINDQWYINKVHTYASIYCFDGDDVNVY